MNTAEELRQEIENEKVARARLFAEFENLEARDDGDAGIAERIAKVNASIAAADGRIIEMEARYGRLRYAEQMTEARNFDEGAMPTPDRTVRHEKQSEAREQALRTIERHSEFMDDGAAERTEKLVRGNDPRDLTARYLVAVGSDAYRSAFLKIMADPQHGHLRFSAEEVEAMRVVSAVEQERALNVGTGSAGGFALPLTIDPSIMLTSSGALNPVRRLARGVTVAANEWRGVSSDGVTVAYSAEAAAMTDGSPTLVQPVIQCRRWTAFVPFSWELGQDWGSLQEELVRLIADGRDVNDTTVFATGTSSSNQPQGILTGLGTTQQVITAGTATLAAGDVWALKAAVPDRFKPNTTFAAPPAMVDRIYRLVPNASTSEPQLMDSRDGAIIGRPVSEWSFNAGTSIATSGTLAIAGDFNAAYTIVDRLGLTAVPIPALFSGNTAGGIAYPTGQSGLAVWGRTGAGVVNANALRVLTAR